MKTNLSTTGECSYIPNETVSLTRKGNLNNSVVKFIANEFGEKAAADKVNEGDIGSGRNGTILWFQDRHDRFRTGKIIQVDQQVGSIISEDEQLVHQKFSNLHGLGFNYKPCLFREHLASSLEYGFTSKGIVQGNEMLALVLSLIEPKIVWLSTHNDSDLNLKSVGIFPEVPVYLFPRPESVSKWKDEIKEFNPNYVKISNEFEMIYTQGNDLDLRKDTPHMLQAMAHVRSLLKASHDFFESTLTYLD